MSVLVTTSTNHNGLTLPKRNKSQAKSAVKVPARDLV